MICNDTHGELRVGETEFMFCDLYVFFLNQPALGK